MKRWICWLLMLCVLLSACSQPGTEQTEESVTVESQTQEETTAKERPTLEQEITITSPVWGFGPMDSDLTLGAGGRLRITYTGNRNSVRYVTDAKQVPGYEELAGYDAAYFADKALLVVIVTAGSGSFQPQIGGVKISDQTAMVHLTHNMTGDAGTADMATWILWAEVEAGLEYQWELAGGASQDDNVFTS